MVYRGIQNLVVWLSIVALLVGCRPEDEATSLPLETSSSDLAAAEPDGPREPTPAEAVSVADQTVASKPFTPPFPDRIDLFEPPKRAQSTVRRDDEVGATVELKGFINVDEPRVVLSIDGVIAPIPEGGEKYGVQVISIDPPAAVLQRGRTRWTAKLE
jgi:hypothetical protein